MFREFLQHQGDVAIVFELFIVDAELVEVAGDDPTRAYRMRQVRHVPACLLVRRLLARPLRALGRLVEAYSAALLFYKDAHILVEHVYFSAFHLAFELQRMGSVGNPEDILQKLDPE